MIGKAILRWCIAIVSILAVIVIIMLTPIGLKIGMSLVSRLVPGHLQYQTISGIIIGPIEIKGFQYKDGDTQISIENFKMHWRPLALLSGKLSITQLTADRVHVTMGSASSKTTSKRHKFFIIQIDQANLRDIAIGKTPNDYPLRIQRVDLSSTITPEKIAVSANASISKPYPMQTTLNATGNFSQYTLTLHLNSRHLAWTMYGNGNDQNIRLHIQESQTLGGSLSGNANLRWAPQWQWNVNLNAKNLNFNRLRSDWPRQLNVQLTTQGKIIKDLPTFSAKAHIATPHAKLTLSAKQNKTLSVQWDAAISQLASLIPGSQGSLNTKGQWLGSDDHSVTQGNIDATNLSLFNYHAKQLSGNWRWYPKNHRQSHINITASDVSAKNINLNTLQLQGKGTPQSHRLSGKIGINNANVTFQAKGGVYDKQWKGQLQQLSILSKQFANWHLTKPSNITLSSTHVTTPNLCLRLATRNTQLCIDGQWSATKAWKFTAKALRIDPGLFANLILPQLTLSGLMNLDATVTGKGDQLQTALAKLTLSSGKFRYFIEDNYIDSPFQSGNISFTLDSSALRSKIDMILSKKDSLHITLTLPHYRIGITAPKTQTITGQIRARLDNLNLFSKFIPNVVKPTGKLSADFAIQGTTKQPTVNGKVSLQQGSVALPRLGITLTGINIALSSYDRMINYTATALSKGRPIHIKGKTEKTAKGLTSDITMDADNVLAMNTPEYIVYATPALQFHIVDKKIHMTGSITIPQGIIQPYEFTNVVTLPQDQIIYTGLYRPLSQTQWQIFTKLTITLGKGVTVNTAGLEADITGQVNLTGAPQKTTIGNGRIKITKGKYSTYGKTLKIQSGSFIQFINSPISNPHLNIRAVKRISVSDSITGQRLGVNDITVGVFLRGTFRRPKIQLFSIPATLSQADILSYLVLGYASSINTSANLGLLLEAANALRLGGSGAGIGGVLSQIKQGLGLEEVGIESEALLDAIGNPIDQQSAFVVGKHLTRRIYIRYSLGLGQGPFAPVNIFQLRYSLSKNWVIQTDSSSLGSGIDILYTIEKD